MRPQAECPSILNTPLDTAASRLLELRSRWVRCRSPRSRRPSFLRPSTGAMDFQLWRDARMEHWRGDAPVAHLSNNAHTPNCQDEGRDTRGTQTLRGITVLNRTQFLFLIGGQLFYSVVSAIHQHEPATGIHRPLPLNPPPASRPIPAPRSSRSTGLSSLSYTAASPHLSAYILWCVCGLPRWLSGKESAWQCRRCRFDPWVRKIPWRRKCQPTPEFLPGESHRQRSLVGYSPWGHRELDNSEQQRKMGVGLPHI